MIRSVPPADSGPKPLIPFDTAELVGEQEARGNFISPISWWDTTTATSTGSGIGQVLALLTTRWLRGGGRRCVPHVHVLRSVWTRQGTLLSGYRAIQSERTSLLSVGKPFNYAAVNSFAADVITDKEDVERKKQARQGITPWRLKRTR